MDRARKELSQLLVEAHSNEVALVNTLEAHIQIAEPGSYRNLLRSHLKETKQHATKIQRRLDDLGYARSLFSLVTGLAQNTVKQGLVLAKGPIDMIRGSNAKEKMLRNARDEVMTEGFEIGQYDAIESVARSIGDFETGELAAAIRLDEESMLFALRKEISVLADSFARTLVSETDTLDEPWGGYDDMTVEEIESRLRDASPALALAVRNYERKNKNRSTVIEATEKETVST